MKVFLVLPLLLPLLQAKRPHGVPCNELESYPVIDQNCHLTKDVHCEDMDTTKSGYCLRVSKGVTVDCDKKNIIGPGAITAPSTARPVHWNTTGIFIRGYPGFLEDETVVVKDCNVRDFDIGVSIGNKNVDHNGDPIFINEWVNCQENPCPNPLCQAALNDPDSDDLQCCPGRSDIDGYVAIEESKISSCNFGVIISLSNAELNEVEVTNNIRGIQMQICSQVTLTDVTACYNEVDINQNDGWSNSCFIVGASGTIQADNLDQYGWDCPDTRVEINSFLGDDSVIDCPSPDTPEA